MRKLALVDAAVAAMILYGLWLENPVAGGPRNV